MDNWLQMTTIKLRLTNQRTLERNDIAVEFDDAAIEFLRAYQRNCDRLAEAEMVKSGLPTMGTIRIDSKGFSVDAPPFSNAQLRELLHLARPLFLSSEPHSFEKTMAIIGKAGKGTALAQHLKFLRTLYEKSDLGRYMQINVGGRRIFDDDTVKLWLNAREYHQDADKDIPMKEIEDTLGSEGARAVFASHISSRVAAIFKLSELARYVIVGAEKQAP